MALGDIAKHNYYYIELGDDITMVGSLMSIGPNQYLKDKRDNFWLMTRYNKKS